ncbi:BatA domain-containing protein [Gimesia panareensis]|uniref:Uncharacterized protein n=1 Tax=Gimesia panareensis TaxID=2527978 RepID=A0A518A6R5_9PLAN|nr:BatA domain-containing protein [Gimesia panareensis]QDT26689.1 hypothetical protein Enr10x_19990 [Gimesia panareensis]QDU50409.1 hypothetical protein Pan110_27550 [Gimesia panareensis]
MHFLAPLLLTGTVLATAPIIIHLLNRRRFIRVDWAPMEYLKLTLKTNRRRLRLEQWLLLAIRTLAVLALFLAVARPISSGTNLAGFLAVEGRASRVIVLDDSLSMAYQTGEQSSFSRAQNAVRQVLNQLGPQDSVSVVLASQPTQPLVRMAHLTEKERDKLVSRMNELPSCQMASHWISTLEDVDRQLEEATFPVKEVIIVTDLWSAGWTSEVRDLFDRWSGDQVTVRFIDIGAEPTGNRVLRSLEQNSRIALVDQEVKLTAVIENSSTEPLKSGQALLDVDGNITPVTLPEIPAEKTVSVPVSVRFDQPGQHVVKLSIPADQLLEDNICRKLVNVRQMVDVVLVDGEPGLNPFESETDFLALALSAGNSNWQVTQAESSTWKSQLLTAPDLIVLANVDQLSKERVAELEELVSLGTGLMIFAGDQCDLQLYNERLFKGGKGLLPARINQIQDLQSQGLVVEPIADSPIELLKNLTPELLSRVRPRRFADVVLDPGEEKQVRVLARWNDPQQSPAVLEKRFGEGRVLFWSITADKSWSDWPAEASFVLAMRVAAQEIAAEIQRGENLIAGEPIHFELETITAPQSGELIWQDRDLKPQEIRFGSEAETKTILTSDPIRFAGVVQAAWQDTQTGEQSQKFAINANVEDSLQDKLNEQELQQYLGRMPLKLIRYQGKEMDLSTAGTELWRYLAVVLLGCLISESMLATWIGRRR